VDEVTKKNLHILQVNTFDLAGGSEGSSWNLFQGYRRRGFNSWLAVGWKRSNDPGVLPIPNEASRAAWTRLWRGIQDRGSGTSVEPLARLVAKLACLGEPRRFLERHVVKGIEDFNYPGTWRILDLPPQRPAIVHCHNLHGGYFDLRALPWLSKQVPLILNLRDAWLLSGHCAHSLGCERWKSGCGKCPNLTIAPAMSRDRTSYNWRRKHDIYARSRLYVTAPSQWLIERAQESMLRGVKYRVIPNAIDLKVFQPGDRDKARRVLDLPLDARIVLLTAQNSFKDLATMESALMNLTLPAKKGNLVFICLGNGSHERPLGQGRIRYIGFEREELRVSLYYQASDVFIHAAFGEAFGKTIAEAMACGIPVVATRVGGIPELITDGVNGILVPPGDAPAMSRAIQRLLEDDEFHRKISERAIVDARAQFDLDRQADTFLEWYEEILEDWSQWKYISMRQN
jgi:glycosyltransferase involved in cell wall biosynthesis